MNRRHLFALFEQARQITGHKDFVVIGSLAILGQHDEGQLPVEMAMSNDIDCYTKADPGRIYDAKKLLGEDSVFHIANGFFLDPVSPHLPSLPTGWEHRMSYLEQDGIRIWFLDPQDTAISKYARCAPNDIRWIRAGLLSGLLSMPTIKARLPETTFLDEEESNRVSTQITADDIWLIDNL